MQAVREFVARLAGTLGWRRGQADIEEKLRSHLAVAEDGARIGGGDPRGARLPQGSIALAVQTMRDQSHLTWLDAIRLDIVFAWRQLIRHRLSNAAAILSLSLAIGATAGAARLVDAVLLRSLPVVDPSRLFAVTTVATNGPAAERRDDFDYPTYRRYAQAIGDHADVLIVGMAARQLVTVLPADEPESAFRQYVSGNLFGVFGLQPAAGRLLTAGDDDRPGAHPVAVISYDWWTRRFGGDPTAIGRSIRVGATTFEIVGVAPRGFTGTEPGTFVSLFIPATMNGGALNSPGWSWFRLWLSPARTSNAAGLEQLLQARFPKDAPRLVSAAAGDSEAQKTFRRPLIILVGLAGILLLVACANVANLLSARAVTRGREMSLRMSIGAGRGRLVQLVLIESLLLAVIASGVGAFIASQSSPIVIAMLAEPDRPVRLMLDTGWRAFGFGVALTLVVTVLFGVLPAIRASGSKPIDALKAKGVARGPAAGTWVLIGVQVTFSTFLLVAASLFATTFGHLLSRPLGFAANDVLLLTVEATGEQAARMWNLAAGQLRQVAGVESASVAGWAPLSGNRWRGAIHLPGSVDRMAPVNMIDVGPSYFDTLRMAMLDGHDFVDGEQDVVIVNEAFAKLFFDGASPVGRRVLRHVDKDLTETPVTIVGLVQDAVYSSVREVAPATMYVPLEPRSGATFILRTVGNPVLMTPRIRRALGAAYPRLRLRAAERFGALVEQQMLRERLLAALSAFFASIALLIAGLGIYGVLNGIIARQRREIGIRMALGARTSDVIRRVAMRTALPVLLGAVGGLVAGVIFGRASRSLLFEIVPGHATSLIGPSLALIAACLAALLPPAVRASRIDPAETLRTE